MAQPKIVPIGPGGSVVRARRVAQAKARYILGAGGRNPAADNPFTIKGGKLGSDCIGFVLWCWGLDRYQPNDGPGESLDFSFYDGWINTDSLILDANGPQMHFETISRPFAGCAVVYPSEYKNGKRVKYGHIGIVTAVPFGWGDDLRKVEVIDCNASASRKLSGRAVGVTNASAFMSKRGARFVRFKGQVSDHSSVLDLVFPIERTQTEIYRLGDRTLKLAKPLMKGPDITELQRALGVFGVDGIYGPVTESEVRQFQRSYGLEADGIVGPKTVKKLRDAGFLDS